MSCHARGFPLLRAADIWAHPCRPLPQGLGWAGDTAQASDNHSTLETLEKAPLCGVAPKQLGAFGRHFPVSPRSVTFFTFVFSYNVVQLRVHTGFIVWWCFHLWASLGSS